MTSRRWAAMASALLAAVVIAGGLVPDTLRAQSKPSAATPAPAAAPADTTATPAKFQAATAEWKSKIVPAAARRALDKSPTTRQRLLVRRAKPRNPSSISTPSACTAKMNRWRSCSNCGESQASSLPVSSQGSL